MSSQPIFTIDSLVPEVLIKLENRTTDTSRGEIWVRDALIEISSNPDYRDEFDALEQYGTAATLTSGVQEYPESNFIASQYANLGNMDFLIWLDPPTNSVRKKLEYMSVLESDRFQPLNSLPTQWYRFNANIGFNPVPDLSYQVQPRFVMLHPINDSALGTTVILLPREWNHLLVLAAVELGFIEYSEYDKAANIHKLLYGDPETPKEPGLFKKAKRRHQRERWRSSAALRPVYKRVMWGA